MKIFFIVGEDSGDIIAANLIRSIKKRHENAKCFGIGGPLMKAAGFEELLPMDQLTVFGIWEVLPKIPQLIKIKNAVIEEIEKQQPDAVVTVDFPDFNFIVSKALKRRGIYKGKLLHYVAPSVWAWREGRAKNIAKFLDGIMCLFPMEVEYFTKHGIKAAYVGHPIVENFVQTPENKNFRVINNIPQDVVTLGLFFGSRESEFKKLHNIITQTAKYITDSVGNIQIIVPTLAKHEFEVQSFLEGLKVPAYVSSNPAFKWNAFQACDIAVAVSGTVGMELAYANVPHVITYKVNPLTYIILSILVKVKNAHLVNILLNKPVVPEFIQGDCVPEKIAEAVIELIKNQEKRNEMQESFKEFRNILGLSSESKPSERAAEFVLSMIENKK